MMTDIFSKEKRSWVMSRIRSKNTKMEDLLAKEMKQHNIRFKRYPKIYGNPDFSMEKTVIFIDGCFWHKCPLHYKKPSTRKRFWLQKIENNVKRDKKVTTLLRKKGYNVMRFWEHDLEKRPNYVIEKIIKKLNTI